MTELQSRITFAMNAAIVVDESPAEVAEAIVQASGSGTPLVVLHDGEDEVWVSCGSITHFRGARPPDIS